MASVGKKREHTQVDATNFGLTIREAKVNVGGHTKNSVQFGEREEQECYEQGGHCA